MLVYDRVLNNDERQKVKNYLGGKWFGRKPLASHSRRLL